MIFMFKLKRFFLPVIFSQMFALNSEVHTHFTRQAGCFRPPTWHLEVRRRSICVQGPHLWNHLFNNFRIDCTVQTFKFHVKQYLLENKVQF